MDSFESVVAAVLIDITEAQNQANKYSVIISKDYQKSTALAAFGVPNAVVRSFDISLKFAIDQIGIRNLTNKADSAVLESLDNSFSQVAERVFEQIAEDRRTWELFGRKIGQQWRSQRELITSYLASVLSQKSRPMVTAVPRIDRGGFVGLLSSELVQAVRVILRNYSIAVDDHQAWFDDFTTLSSAILGDAIQPAPLDELTSVPGLQIQYENLNELDANRLVSVTLKVDMRSFDWAVFNGGESTDSYSSLIQQ